MRRGTRDVFDVYIVPADATISVTLFCIEKHTYGSARMQEASSWVDAIVNSPNYISIQSDTVDDNSGYFALYLRRDDLLLLVWCRKLIALMKHGASSSTSLPMASRKVQVPKRHHWTRQIPIHRLPNF